MRKLFGISLSQVSLLRPVAFPDGFTTVYKKALTPDSLASPLLTRDNQVVVTNGQNTLGYTMTLVWQGNAQQAGLRLVHMFM